MKYKDLKNKNKIELKLELINYLKKQFNVRLKIKNGKSKKTHLIRLIRHTIAYIKMLLKEKENIKNYEKKYTYSTGKNCK